LTKGKKRKGEGVMPPYRVSGEQGIEGTEKGRRKRGKNPKKKLRKKKDTTAN
jgi:hypothetical protein